MKMRRTIITAFLGLNLWVGQAYADEPVSAVSEQSTVENAGAATQTAVQAIPQTLDEALNATPPMRAKIGKVFAQDEKMLAEIDQWIQNTAVDEPKNLIMRDLLLAMPKPVSGPYLVALAKKAKDPSVQASWKRHLEAYPGPYANVLAAWVLNASGNPDRFQALLKEYAELQPEAALKLWAQLIENNTVTTLDRVADYGLGMSGAVSALLSRLKSDQLDENQRLRLYRAITKSVQKQVVDVSALDAEGMAIARQDAETLIAHSAVSRRIVGLDVVASLRLAELAESAEKRWHDAKNSTERAHALTAMVKLTGAERAQDVADALKKGDEIIRLTAAELMQADVELAKVVDQETLMTAFNAEIWPQTQLALYGTLKGVSTDANFVKSVMMNGQMTAQTRMAAVDDLSGESAASLTLNDMATLQREAAPLDLIAATAEALYTYHPDSRDKLRTWIAVQRPFERRLLTTFARFIAIDNRESSQMLDYVRDVCSHAVEDENILQPCMNYLEDHAESDQDKELLKQLHGRKKQFDMMMDL